MTTNAELSHATLAAVRSHGSDGAASHDVWYLVCDAYGVASRDGVRDLPPEAQQIPYATVVGLLSSLVERGVIRSEARSGSNRQFFAKDSVAAIGEHTVEDAYARWAKDSPFGDNPVAKAGFEAGWSAVFGLMVDPP